MHRTPDIKFHRNMIGTLEIGNFMSKPGITGSLGPNQKMSMIPFFRPGFDNIMQKSVSHYLLNWLRTKFQILGILM